jgi:hypothetical protein
MPELEFSRDEIEQLAQKLSSPESQLTGQEQMLLLAIFSAASAHVAPRQVAESRSFAEPPLAELKDQFVTAFIPGQDTQFEVTFRIGFPPMPPPRVGGPPPPGPPESPPPGSPEPPAAPEPAPAAPEPTPPAPEPTPENPPSPPA